MEETTREYLRAVLTNAVFGGSFIPAHDATFDAAETIADALTTFYVDVFRTRDSEQADDALLELVDAIKSGAYDVSRGAHLTEARS